MIDIPKDIPNKQEFSQLKKQDKAIVAFAVLMNVSNQEAFMRYNPHYMRADGKGMNEEGVQASRQFWGWGKIKDYRTEYEKTVEEFFGGGKRKKIDADIDDNRIEGALKKLLNQAIGLLDSGDNLDPDSVKTIVEVFRKMNLLKDEEQTEMRPIRVLPSRCSECRMRIAVESMVLNGEMLDMCAYCKCRSIAEGNGYRFNDGKDLLEIPQEVIAELESKNNVKLTDILDGKIEN